MSTSTQGIELTITTSGEGLKQRHNTDTERKGGADDDSDVQEDAPVTQSQIMARSLRAQIKKLTSAYLIASLIHIMVTIVIFCMAYSHPGEPFFNDDGINIVQVAPAKTFSSTGVICAFGALTTCVFVITATWKTYKGADQTELPNWEWHNDSFLTAVGTSFFLIVFLWPALDNFIIHSLGQNFFPLLNSLTGNTKATAVAHILFAVFLFIIDVLNIIYVTAQLTILQAPRRAAAEDAKATGIGAVTNGIMSGKEDDEDDNQAKPEDDDSDDGNERHDTSDIQFIFLTWKHKIFGFLTLALHTAYGVTLIVVAAKTKGNSGVVICIVLYAPFFLLFWICSFWFFKSSIANENWLIKFRIAVVLHFVAAYCFFWISLVVFVLKNNPDNASRLDFFSAINRIEDEEDGRGRAALSIVLLICFPLILAIYAVILFFHTKAMWALDELASLRLLERLQQFQQQYGA